MEEAPALAREQELGGLPRVPRPAGPGGPGHRGDPVQHRLRIAPVVLAAQVRVDDVGDLAAAQVDPGQVGPGDDVGPDPAAGPFQVVEPADPLALAADPDDLERGQGSRVPPDQLAAAVAGQDVVTGAADAPALPVVRDGPHQGQGARVPAQRGPLPPGELPDGLTRQADALREQLRRKRRAGLPLPRAEPVPAQRRLTVQPGALPHGPVGQDQALRKAAARVRQAAQHLQPVEPHARLPRAVATHRARAGRSGRSAYPPSASPARRSKTLREPKSPVSTQDTPAAVKYSGSMTRPAHQANCVAWRASCASSASCPSRASRSTRVMMTFPSVNAGAGGTGSRYRSPISRPSRPGPSLARPAAATTRPARVDPLTRLATSRTR